MKTKNLTTILLVFLVVLIGAKQNSVFAQVPIAKFSSSDTSFCDEAGKCIDFTDLSTGNPTSWKWIFLGAMPDTATQQNPTAICYYVPGTYLVTLIVSNSSGSDTASLPIVFGSGRLTPIVQPVNGCNRLVCSDSGIASYQWYFNGSPIPGGIDSIYFAQQLGNYAVYVADTNGCSMLSNSFNVSCLTYLDVNVIRGNSFLDINKNGLLDAGEPPFDNTWIKTFGNGKINLTQPYNGEFTDYADTGNIQTTVIPPLYYVASPLIHNTYFPNPNDTDSVNFAFTPIPGVQDLRITMIPVGVERPGFNFEYDLLYSNVGTDTVSSMISMTKDSRMLYVSSNPSWSYTNGDSAVWNYSNLLPNESRYIYVTLHLPPPPTVNIGDLVSSTCVIEPVATDSVPNDNHSGLPERRVRGSYDPNDKAMLGGENFTTLQISKGDFMTYLIRFQNTGSDTAFNVMVQDTLSNNLDYSTFEMVSASHAYNVLLQNNKYLQWTFNNILLPDSHVNEPASHGYICYRIKPKTTVVAGNVIKNTAYIYFDYNLPVETNTASTAIVFPAGINDLTSSSNGLRFYPNPAKNEFTVVSPFKMENAILNVYNLIGNKIYSTILTTNQQTINCKEWPAGIYFIRIEGSGNAGVVKMVKMD